ncbi:MAG: hypothetical protein IH933_09720 [Euryarchaeota archaeon]|nr:hypothetical protein [Euryarchaeota archaeon]
MPANTDWIGSYRIDIADTLDSWFEKPLVDIPFRNIFVGEEEEFVCSCLASERSNR